MQPSRVSAPAHDAENLLSDDWAARVITEFGRPVTINISDEAAAIGLEIEWG